MPIETNVLALVKGQERFIYLFDDDCTDKLKEVLVQHAADKDLNLTWEDAAMFSRKSRALVLQKNPLEVYNIRYRDYFSRISF